MVRIEAGTVSPHAAERALGTGLRHSLLRAHGLPWRHRIARMVLDSGAPIGPRNPGQERIARWLGERSDRLSYGQERNAPKPAEPIARRSSQAEWPAPTFAGRTGLPTPGTERSGTPPEGESCSETATLYPVTGE